MLWQQAGKEDSISGGRHSPTVIAFVKTLTYGELVWYTLTGTVSQAFAWLRKVFVRRKSHWVSLIA